MISGFSSNNLCRVSVPEVEVNNNNKNYRRISSMYHLPYEFLYSNPDSSLLEVVLSPLGVTLICTFSSVVILCTSGDSWGSMMEWTQRGPDSSAV